MKRRQFITLLGSAAFAWPLAARAQQPVARVGRVGAQLNLTEGDPESRLYTAAFEHRLQELGWTIGRNLQIEYRWTNGETARIRQTAMELVALAPDVILTVGGGQVGPLQQVTSTIPIVFVQTADPVGAGFVDSLARPGRNATGFTVFEYGIGVKWVELLKEIAPRLTRVAVLRDTTNPSGTGLFGAIQAVAPSLRVEITAIGLRNAGEIEREVTAFARSPNGGLVVTPAGPVFANRELILRLAEQHHLPAVFAFRHFVTGGGLISYGPDAIDQYRQAAGYVDRILKGEKPADLPVQAPVKYETVINLKTAKALGLTVPNTLLVSADEVIE